jgi:hypothetical protein
MYRWYANSKVCFAYLVDVETYQGMDGRHTARAWDKCRWFTRGWTLQELIAPTVVEFYEHSWHYFGTKQSLFDELAGVTGITREVLQTNDLSSISVAQKMSWASQRRTSRKEDMAYCLLGLFDINMPLLYGEGEKAFLRLQEHIAASSTDHTIFAWGVLPESALADQLRSYRSIFASSPADFSQSIKLIQKIIVQPDTWTQTNRSFHGVFPTIPAPAAKQLFHRCELPVYIDDEDHLLILNCQHLFGSGLRSAHIAGVWVRIIGARDDGKHGFCRVTDTITFVSRAGIRQLLDSSPEKFRKNLWLATTPRMIIIPRDHFSKRLGGFLVRTSVAQDVKYVHFNTYGLYGNQVNGDMSILPCKKLPVTQYGGLIGIVTVKVVAQKDGIDFEEAAAVIFGYPSNSTRPFAKVVRYQRAEGYVEKKMTPLESLLDFAERKFLEPDNAERKDHAPCDYRSKSFGLTIFLGTVLHKDMIFTKLEIELYTW